MASDSSQAFGLDVIERRGHRTNGGVADQHVKPPVALVERRAEPVERGIVPYVERSERGRGAGGAHCVVELLKPADGSRQRHHVRAPARERERSRITDAA